MVAPTTAPTLERPRSPDERGAPLRDECGDVLPDASPVREHQVLHVAPLLDSTCARGRRCPRRGAGTPAGTARPSRAPRYGVDRQRVGEGGLSVARLEVRGGIRARGRADVAALPVGDHEQPRAARVGAHALERGEAVGAERLEEGELRLHGDDVRRDGVDDPAAEAAVGRRRLGAAEHRLAAQLDREQLEAGVEPDDELAPLALDRFGEPVGEGRGRDPRARVEILRHREQSSARGSRPPSSQAARRSSASGTTRSSGGGLRRNEPIRSSSSASSGALDASAPALGSGGRGEAGFELQAAGAPGGSVRAATTRPGADEERPLEPVLDGGHEQAELERAQPLQLAQRARHLLERRDPVAQARGVLEALRRRERRRAARAAPGAPPQASPSQSPSARAAAAAVRRLLIGPYGLGVSVRTSPIPRRRR